MHSAVATVLVAAGSVAAVATSGHGAGALGTEMGPVAFLWPADRPWSAGHDNTAPCGSSQGVGNRTEFPLTGGFVSLTIADDAYDVDFSISYSENPTSQSDFTQQIVETKSKLEAGHQCYKLPVLSGSVKAGSPATIQMEYRAKFVGEANGNDQTFYACADIEFVDATAFTANPPCFSTDGIESPDTTNTTPTVETAGSSNTGNALTGGAIAGITVGTVVGSLAVVGLIAFFVFRRRRSAPTNVEAGLSGKGVPETASVSSVRR